MVNLGLESELIEFKKSTGELNEGIISIVAMLNKNGKGTVYFGVKPNGDAIGQQVSESTLRDVARKIHEDISPEIYPSVSLVENLPGVIKVDFSGFDRPYSAKGLFYIRISDEDRKLGVTELLRLIQKTDSSNAAWEKIETDETPDDIDERLLKSYMDKANQCGRISQEYTDKISTLKKLGLLSNGHLNNAGRVLFSSNKPVCLKLAVFATDEKLTFIDTQVFNGNLFELIDKGQEYIKEHINFSAEIVGAKRIETPEIPLEAIREAVVNSLCHSSFNTTVNNQIYITPTRVVIFNPGSFPFGFEPSDFAYEGAPSILRNPIISNILYYSKDIDSWATGFRRIFKCCKQQNVKVTYAKRNQGFEICFFRNSNIKNLSEEELILVAIKNNSKVTIAELADLIGKSKRTTQGIIKKLKDNNLIKRNGSKNNSSWIVMD